MEKIESGGISIAVIRGTETVIKDVQSALDLMATVSYELDGCHRIVIEKSLIKEEFFDLKTKLAGDILQKFANYQVKLAIVGDFTGYTSNSLKDFIYECNQGNTIFFLPSEQQAIERLSGKMT